MQEQSQPTPTNRSQTGAKIGWIGGWIGAFLWLFILGIVWLFQGKVAHGLTGCAIFVAGALSVLAFLPWRNPETRMWRLMVLPYVIMLSSIPWAIWAFGGFEEAETRLSWYMLLWVLPILGPLFTMGYRKWSSLS